MGAQISGMIMASEWFSGLDIQDKCLFGGGLFLFGGVYDLRPLLATTMKDPVFILRFLVFSHFDFIYVCSDQLNAYLDPAFWVF